MGCGNSLNRSWERNDWCFWKDAYSQWEIAKKINRSRSVVNNYIKKQEQNTQKFTTSSEKANLKMRNLLKCDIAQSAGAVEYTRGKTHPQWVSWICH